MTDRRMKRKTALRAAQELLELLRPGVTRIEIAGSVRRGRATVKDLELVALPRQEAAP